MQSSQINEDHERRVRKKGHRSKIEVKVVESVLFIGLALKEKRREKNNGGCVKYVGT